MKNNNDYTSENAKENNNSSNATTSGTSTIVPRRTPLEQQLMTTDYGPLRSPSTWSTTYGPNGPPNSGMPRSLYNNMMNHHPLIPSVNPTADVVQYAPPSLSLEQTADAYVTQRLQYSWTATQDNRFNINASPSLQPISRDLPPLMPSLQMPERHSKLCLFDQMRPTRGTTMALECQQGDVRIRFCSTCNALWPANGTPATHLPDGCAVTKMFPENCVPQFECNTCCIRHRLDDIGTHVAVVHHDVDVQEYNEPNLSCLCVECNTIMYSPWYVFVEHRREVHGWANGDSLLDRYESRKPMVMIVMRWLILDYLENGRDNLLYVCLVCKHFGTDPRNPKKRCSGCDDPYNKFYCEHCNVIFSCLQSGYDIHRLTFEHFYLLQNRQLAFIRFGRRRRA